MRFLRRQLRGAGFHESLQERSDTLFEAKLACRPERIGSRERRAWDWRVLASLDQPKDDFHTPALELSQSIFDHGALDAAPGKLGVSETNPPLAGLTLGCLGLQEIRYRQQFLQSQHITSWAPRRAHFLERLRANAQAPQAWSAPGQNARRRT
ncbi:hypothetical protein [Bradyrhizobium sp. HKCCYLRH1062]|uniref:hypothetical protein n=1 Tax=unclassified Bradyrhizobium TaxID=2631580 RepID=UPI003EBF23BE